MVLITSYTITDYNMLISKLDEIIAKEVKERNVMSI